MELLQLRYFYDSAIAESFAVTAEKHMVPATSVSASVKRLEKELGCALFDRTANRIRLNENGRRLQKSLCLVFSELDAVTDALRTPQTDTREIRMLVRAARSQVTDRIIAFREKEPEIAFRTVLDFSERDLSKYDVIIDAASEHYAGFDRFELLSMRIRVMASEGHPLLKTVLPFSRLAAEPFISWGEESNMHRLLVDACAEAGFSPRIAVETGDKACYERLIASGVGVGLGRDDTPPVGCAYLPISDFDERYTVYVYYKSDAGFGNVARFLDFLRNPLTEPPHCDKL